LVSPSTAYGVRYFMSAAVGAFQKVIKSALGHVRRCFPSAVFFESGIDGSILAFAAAVAADDADFLSVSVAELVLLSEDAIATEAPPTGGV
jgi:hypothetical protein